MENALSQQTQQDLNTISSPESFCEMEDTILLASLLFNWVMYYWPSSWLDINRWYGLTEFQRVAQIELGRPITMEEIHLAARHLAGFGVIDYPHE